MTWLEVHKRYVDQTQRRKQYPVFLWYERITLGVGMLWLFDALIGFSNKKWSQEIDLAAWLLTAITLVDMAWFLYMNRKQR